MGILNVRLTFDITQLHAQHSEPRKPERLHRRDESRLINSLQHSCFFWKPHSAPNSGEFLPSNAKGSREFESVSLRHRVSIYGETSLGSPKSPPQRPYLERRGRGENHFPAVIDNSRRKSLLANSERRYAPRRSGSNAPPPHRPFDQCRQQPAALLLGR